MTTATRPAQKWEKLASSLQVRSLVCPFQQFMFEGGAVPAEIRPGLVRNYRPVCSIRELSEDERVIVVILRTRISLTNEDRTKDVAQAEVIAGLSYDFDNQVLLKKIPKRLLPKLENRAFVQAWPYISQTIHDLLSRAGLYDLPRLPVYTKRPSWFTPVQDKQTEKKS